VSTVAGTVAGERTSVASISEVWCAIRPHFGQGTLEGQFDGRRLSNHDIAERLVITSRGHSLISTSCKFWAKA
jgi:hypothetical protein